MWKEVPRTRKKISPVRSLNSRPVTSVTHDSPSRSPESRSCTVFDTRRLDGFEEVNRWPLPFFGGTIFLGTIVLQGLRMQFQQNFVIATLAGDAVLIIIIILIKNYYYYCN